MNMSEMDYAELTSALDKVFEEHEVRGIVINVETKSGEVVIQCACNVAESEPVLH